ncbi:MAG: N-acetylneuraminate synthase family protein [Sedimentisphaerales bacterium]|nr:N-acetylneuraminate synthase family protein [Sedimentisphaerales bacterium]
MNDLFDKPVFIFEMANNHMGDIDHGKTIIREFSQVIKNFREFTFGFKFQYRNLDTFIHPQYKNNHDYKYIKRFSETRIEKEAFKQLKDEFERCGFISVCTPFDETSVDLIEEHDYRIIKIASCSITDWPLLERISETHKPIIGSTAGASLEDIDKVVSFFEHRQKQFVLMHCVGSYPTPDNLLELNQIDLFKSRYPKILIGYSTHEEPDNLEAIKIAVAKGAAVFERHVGIQNEKYKLNAYSSTPEQISKWLSAAREAYDICGVSNRRRDISQKEQNDLRGLQRGVFAKTDIKAGEIITGDKIFYAIPNFQDQLVANSLSKYLEIVAQKDIPALQPLLSNNIQMTDSRDKVLNIIKDIKGLVLESGIKLQNKIDFELSHHYGIDQFHQYGCTIMNIINREYCKKLILLLAGQGNPTHTHKIKEETFHILYGNGWIKLNGETRNFAAGDLLTVERNVPHSFGTNDGAILEEVSTTHIKADSYYDDPLIDKTENRKTYMTFWIDWLEKPIN